MEITLLSLAQYESLVKMLEEIKGLINSLEANESHKFLDNQQFIKLMKISKRTAQVWRDEGIVSFSQVGGKIYYRMSDIQKLLDSNHHTAFRKK